MRSTITRDDASGSIAWAEVVLRDQGMPPDELRIVLTSTDGEVVRRHLDLHLERLEERLSAQRRSLVSAKRFLIDAAVRREF
jgi:hypothetical protein